jgi:hypothetical protein
MSLASSAGKALFHRRKALLQANIGVLGQKLDLMTALRTTLGPDAANERFAEKCPVVGASVGQHFRHSTDHMERVAASILKAEKRQNNNQEAKLQYDIRVRGGNDENDMNVAEERIRRVTRLFKDEIDAVTASSSSSSDVNDEPMLDNQRVLACFLLSGDPSEDEFLLSSTIERELGFVAHHAIHHLAMVKIITMHTLAMLPPGALPEGFGMAPSTIVYESK